MTTNGLIGAISLQLTQPIGLVGYLKWDYNTPAVTALTAANVNFQNSQILNALFHYSYVNGFSLHLDFYR